MWTGSLDEGRYALLARYPGDDLHDVSESDPTVVNVMGPSRLFEEVKEDVQTVVGTAVASRLAASVTQQDAVMTGARARFARVRACSPERAGSVPVEPIDGGGMVTASDGNVVMDAVLGGAFAVDADGCIILCGSTTLSSTWTPTSTQASVASHVTIEGPWTQSGVWGAHLGVVSGQGSVDDALTGMLRTSGLDVGLYTIHEILNGLLVDAFLTTGVTRVALDAEYRALDLHGVHLTPMLITGGGIAGVWMHDARTVRPAFSVTYAASPGGAMRHAGHAASVRRDEPQRDGDRRHADAASVACAHADPRGHRTVAGPHGVSVHATLAANLVYEPTPERRQFGVTVTLDRPF